MPNFKLAIEYDGTRYCGWQTQKHSKVQLGLHDKPSIQKTIEQCLHKIFKRKVAVMASGRTDSGVHALGQVVHCSVDTAMEPQVLLSALNGNLPFDIRVRDVREVPRTFHARYSVRSKMYRYIILRQKDRPVFFDAFCYWIKYPLNVQAMRKAAQHFLGTHDFKAFCASGSAARSTTRTIKRLSIKTTILEPFSYPVLLIEIEANGFLYKMVRTIIGTLIEVGRGKMKPGKIPSILKNKQRQNAGPCVPAKGLYLVNVAYPLRAESLR